jgi:hypothetical protein
MNMRFFRDSRVVPVTERRPLASSCIGTYTPIASGRHLVANTSVRRIACAHEKITCSLEGYDGGRFFPHP